MKYQEYTGNGNAERRSPAEIEADLAAIRSEMSHTIQRLEEKFSPRAFLDQFFSRAKGMGEGSSEFATNLGTTVRDNPVPVLLLASGVVSLLASERMSSKRIAGVDYDQSQTWQQKEHGEGSRSEAMRAKLSETKQRIGERMGKLGERAGELRGRAGERAGKVGERAGEFGERARLAREKARERGVVMRDRARERRQQVTERGQRTLEEEPLVIVGLGVALGALLGSGMPVSERERRALGKTGERLAERARHTAQQGAERAKSIAKEVGRTVNQQISGEGGAGAGPSESPTGQEEPTAAAAPGQERPGAVIIEETRTVRQVPGYGSPEGETPTGGSSGEGEPR